MRTSSCLAALPFLLVLACLAPPTRSNGSGGSGGHPESGGSGGYGGSGGSSSGGATSSGGASGSGGTTESGGVTTSTDTTASSGGAGGSGGQGSGGATTTARPDDASADQQAGSGGTNAGGRSATGGSSGASSTGRGGSGGATTAASGGRAGSGGTMGSGGETGTGGSTAPTACTFPSNWNPGSATYTTYSLPNPVTACGYNGNQGNNTIKNIASAGNFAAIPGQSSSNFDTSSRCGACVQIGNAIITIVDECPYDGSNNPPCKANPSGHLDLSNAAASAGGVQGDPNKHGQTQWKFIPCPVTGNVIVRLKNGNSNEMFIENEIVPIASVTCGGQNGSRTSYGAWHFGSNIPGASCTVTDIANRTISVTAGSSQGQDVDTGRQFPKCL